MHVSLFSVMQVDVREGREKHCINTTNDCVVYYCVS